MAEEISPLRALMKVGRFDDHTLRTLQVIVESPKSGELQVGKSLKEFLRSESVVAIQQLNCNSRCRSSIHNALHLLDFFVCAFEIIGDVESWLALRYEGLAMRAVSVTHPELQVPPAEWMEFAQDAFHHGFYSIVSKACQNALSHFDIKTVNEAFINQIQSLKDDAMRLSAAHAVQVQASEYLKQKNLCLKQSSQCKVTQHPASMSFRNGIRQQNVRNLLRLQNFRND